MCSVQWLESQPNQILYVRKCFNWLSSSVIISQNRHQLFITMATYDDAYAKYLAEDTPCPPSRIHIAHVVGGKDGTQQTKRDGATGLFRVNESFDLTHHWWSWWSRSQPSKCIHRDPSRSVVESQCGASSLCPLYTAWPDQDSESVPYAGEQQRCRSQNSRKSKSGDGFQTVTVRQRTYMLHIADICPALLVLWLRSQWQPTMCSEGGW
jgi:hypothetical protein